MLVDGSNVVNQSQQRFYVEANDVWPIQLLLYTAQFQARDALFKFPIGSGLHIEQPGDEVEMPFGPNAALSIRSLVRGIYRVNVYGAPGISPISPIALSRDQDVQLLVISYLDIAIGAVLAAALGFGLVFIGRPKLFFMLGKPRVLAQSLADAYRSMPQLAGCGWQSAGLPPPAESVRTQCRDEPPSCGCAAICAFAYTVGGCGGAPGFVGRAWPAGRRSNRQPFTAPLSALARRIERALRHTPNQPTRRKLSLILAYTFFAALVAAVGGLSKQGAANAPTAPTYAKGTAVLVQTALPLIILHRLTQRQPSSHMRRQWSRQPSQPICPADACAGPINSCAGPTHAIPGNQNNIARLWYAAAFEPDSQHQELGRRCSTAATAAAGARVLYLPDQHRIFRGNYAVLDHPIPGRARAASDGVVDRLTINALNSCGKDCSQLNGTGDNAR